MYPQKPAGCARASWSVIEERTLILTERLRGYKVEAVRLEANFLSNQGYLGRVVGRMLVIGRVPF